MRARSAVEDFVSCMNVWLRSIRVVQGKMEDERRVDAGLVGKEWQRQHVAGSCHHRYERRQRRLRRSNIETM